MPEYPSAVKREDVADRLMRQDEVLKVFGGGPTLLNEAVLSGRFPRPIRIVDGGRAKAWIASEVTAWLESRKTDRIEPYTDERPHIVARRKAGHQPRRAGVDRKRT